MVKNRRSMTRMAVVFCIAALTACASIAHAEDESCGSEQGQKQRHHNFKKIAVKLGLSDAQNSQVKALFQANKEVVKPIFASLRTERKNLQALIHADTVDEAAIRAQTAKITGIQADLNVDRAKVGVQFRAILTPAQLVTLKSMHKKDHHKGDRSGTPAE